MAVCLTVALCVACRPADQPQDPHHLQCQPDPGGQPARPDRLHAQRLQAGGLCDPGGGPCCAWPGGNACLEQQAWLGSSLASVTGCPGEAYEWPALQDGLAPSAPLQCEGQPSASGMVVLSASHSVAFHERGLLPWLGVKLLPRMCSCSCRLNCTHPRGPPTYNSAWPGEVSSAGMAKGMSCH